MPRQLLFQMGICIMPSRMPDEVRRCLFCHMIGDAMSDGPARLLNFDVDKWVHLNCALWADDVYETESGSLVNVDMALKKSLNAACTLCKETGASIKCFKVRCDKTYHLTCSIKDKCTFYKNKVSDRWVGPGHQCVRWVTKFVGWRGIGPSV